MSETETNHFENTPEHAAPSSEEVTDQELGDESPNQQDEAPFELGATINLHGQDVSVSMNALELFANHDAVDNMAFRAQDKLGYGTSVEDRTERGQVFDQLAQANPALQYVREYWQLYRDFDPDMPADELRAIGEKLLDLREKAGFKGELPKDTYDPVRVAFGKPAWG